MGFSSVVKHSTDITFDRVCENELLLLYLGFIFCQWAQIYWSVENNAHLKYTAHILCGHGAPQELQVPAVKLYILLFTLIHLVLILIQNFNVWLMAAIFKTSCNAPEWKIWCKNKDYHRNTACADLRDYNSHSQLAVFTKRMASFITMCRNLSVN